MKNSNLIVAKNALDKIIEKSRVHLYKPIQIAEILYHYRMFNDIDLDNIETYRNISKHWRDEISQVLVGRVCTSSAKFQDNVFEPNAMPPELIKVLAMENKKLGGSIEAYIYGQFSNKHSQLADALAYCKHKSKDAFYVKQLIDSFWNEPGLKRSVDKIYEIIVYSLFSTLVKAMKLKVDVSVDASSIDILKEFNDFARMVMSIDFQHMVASQDAKVYRLGVTNAADRGLDMYSNWGPAIQIKHLSLNIELAKNIVNGISSDRIVIVCKDAEKDVIVSLLTQIGWKSRIQSIITENNLVEWYEKALRGKYAYLLADQLLQTIRDEITREFPSTKKAPSVLLERKYDNMPAWVLA